MKTKKFFSGIAVLGAVVLVLIGVLVSRQGHRESASSAVSNLAITPSSPTSIGVVTTLFPWYDMARTIGGDRVKVTLLLPSEADPHTFEPSQEDFATIDASDVFFFTGKSLEPWAADIAQNAVARTSVVDASEGIDLLPNPTPDPEDPDQISDPHFWFDPEKMSQVTEHLVRVLSDKDPSGATAYRERAAAYESHLKTLDEEYRKTLSACRKKTILSEDHDAFGYLTERYGLSLQASSESTAKMKGLNTAEKIIREEIARGITFFDVLEKNLVVLREDLSCASITPTQR